MAKESNTTITRDDFECWLIQMDDSIANFISSLPPTLSNRLDYSKQSLDLLEQWLLGEYSSIADLLKSSENQTLDGCSQYIGEVFRRHIGGHWDIELANKVDAFYAIPKLTNFGSGSSPISPVSMTTALLDRRTGHYLSRILSNLERRYKTSSV